MKLSKIILGTVMCAWAGLRMDAAVISGVTLDALDADNLVAITNALGSMSVRPTARVVLDPDRSPAELVPLLAPLHAVADVLLCPCDSTAMSNYPTAARYVARFAACYTNLAPHVDLWEVGNEVNGEGWLGLSADAVATNIVAAYRYLHALGCRTELTPYMFKPGDQSIEMEDWLDAHVPEDMRQGLDAVLVSYYDDDNGGEHEDWETMFDRLADLFPTAALGFGECGFAKPQAAGTAFNARVAAYYDLPRYHRRDVGGCFWWNWQEDCVPATNNTRWTAINAACARMARRLDFPAATFRAPGADARAILAGLAEFVATENVWIASLQLTNGALAEADIPADGEVSVNPYFADIAMMALLREGALYADNVTDYLNWHFAHLNTAAQDVSGVAGTIYDYTVVMTNGTVFSEKPTQQAGDDGKFFSYYDSTDSYAATFLSLLREYVRRADGADYVVEHAGQIDLIVDALLATMKTNGLTEATPAYPVQYLMDNCEVYRGLDDAVALYRDCIVPGTDGDARHTNAYQKAVAAFVAVSNAIEKSLWNAGGGHYEVALEDGAVAEVFAWTNFYQDATSQLFPVACGVTAPSSARARALYTAFCGHFRWQALEIPDEYYWGHNAYAAALMGDVDRTLDYLAAYWTAATARHEYPLYNADAGWAVRAACEVSNALASAAASSTWCATVDGLATNATVTLLDASFLPSLTADAFGAASFWLAPGDYVCRIDSPAGGFLRRLAVSAAGTAVVTETTLAITALSATNGVPVISACSPASLMESGRVETVYATNLSATVWTNDASITSHAAAVFMKLRVK